MPLYFSFLGGLKPKFAVKQRLGRSERSSQPLAAPRSALGLGHAAAGGIMLPHIAYALRTQAVQAFVKAFAAMAKGLRIRTVAQGDHTVANMA